MPLTYEGRGVYTILNNDIQLSFQHFHVTSRVIHPYTKTLYVHMFRTMFGTINNHLLWFTLMQVYLIHYPNFPLASFSINNVVWLSLLAPHFLYYPFLCWFNFHWNLLFNKSIQMQRCQEKNSLFIANQKITKCTYF